MNYELMEQQLSQLPLFVYTYIDPESLEFSERIRYICKAECPRYDKTWACPPAVGSVAECKGKCLGYKKCLMIGTITEIQSIANMEEALATRPEHERLTNEVRGYFREQGIEPYILSTEACAVCERCAWLDGLPCRMPGRMHPCLESHGINLIPVLEENGLDFVSSEQIVTWYSLLFFNE